MDLFASDFSHGVLLSLLPDDVGIQRNDRRPKRVNCDSGCVSPSSHDEHSTSN
ncbi:hypothetical protein BLA29_012843 [Euroglyphus maynei]|uniref:Uncharacterized protein n=1 Tax=Euroglyphus maynei TaxID=6958 RepID=A0A1Y3B1J5_EURMA|nr:hypothetical protein BLA29_012843 [Euroglyphus maynei]